MVLERIESSGTATAAIDVPAAFTMQLDSGVTEAPVMQPIGAAASISNDVSRPTAQHVPWYVEGAAPTLWTASFDAEFPAVQSESSALYALLHQDINDDAESLLEGIPLPPSTIGGYLSAAAGAWGAVSPVPSET